MGCTHIPNEKDWPRFKQRDEHSYVQEPFSKQKLSGKHIHQESSPGPKHPFEKLAEKSKDTHCNESKEGTDHKVVNLKLHDVHKSNDTQTGGSHNGNGKIGRDNVSSNLASVKPRPTTSHEYKHDKELQDQKLPAHGETLSTPMDRPENISPISMISPLTGQNQVLHGSQISPSYVRPTSTPVSDLSKNDPNRSHNPSVGPPARASRLFGNNKVSKNSQPDPSHEDLRRIVKVPHINRTKLQDPVVVLVIKDKTGCNSSEERKKKTPEVLIGQLLRDYKKHSSLKGEHFAEELGSLTQKSPEVPNRNGSVDDGSAGDETSAGTLSKIMETENQKESDTDALKKSFDWLSKFSADQPDKLQKEHPIKARESSRENIQFISSNTTPSSESKNIILPGYGETVSVSSNGNISADSQIRDSERPEGKAHEHQNARFLDNSLHIYEETANNSDNDVSKKASISKRGIPDNHIAPNVENYNFSTLQKSTVDLQRDVRPAKSEESRRDVSVLSSDSDTTLSTGDASAPSDANTTTPSFDNDIIFDNELVLSPLDAAMYIDYNTTTTLDDNSTFPVADDSTVFLKGDSKAAFSRIDNATVVSSDNSTELPANSTESSFGDDAVDPVQSQTDIPDNTDIPDETISILDNSSSDNTTFVPDNATNIPDNATYTPDYSIYTTDNTYIPDNTTILDNTTYSPDNTNIPDNTTYVPDSTTYMPDNATEIPNNTMSIFDSNTYSTHNNANILHNISFFSDNTIYSTDNTTDIPDNTTNAR